MATYSVAATVWLSSGVGKPWSGDVTIKGQANSKRGLQALQDETHRLATRWAEDRGMSLNGRVDMNDWSPKRR